MPDLTHQPVLPKEAIDALCIEGERTGGIYLDGTFGRGGHSQLILKKLGKEGRLIAFDKDPDAIAAAARLKDPRFEAVHGSFAGLGRVLHERGIGKVDGILLDLGLSSPQVEAPARGFSFRLDGPLDMRMDPTKGISAAEWLASENEQKIAEVLHEYGEERFAVQIATAIVNGRLAAPITGTRQLAGIVAKAVRTREAGKDPATRTFQAIRIFVNRELEDLALGLEKGWKQLALHGRMAVISFHSLEDRIVKCFFANKAHVKQPDRRLPIKAKDLPRAEMRLLGKVKPSLVETKHNPRARSAVLRIAERIVLSEGEAA